MGQTEERRAANLVRINARRPPYPHVALKSLTRPPKQREAKKTYSETSTKSKAMHGEKKDMAALMAQADPRFQAWRRLSRNAYEIKIRHRPDRVGLDWEAIKEHIDESACVSRGKVAQEHALDTARCEGGCWCWQRFLRKLKEEIRSRCWQKWEATGKLPTEKQIALWGRHGATSMTGQRVSSKTYRRVEAAKYDPPVVHMTSPNGKPLLRAGPWTKECWKVKRNPVPRLRTLSDKRSELVPTDADVVSYSCQNETSFGDDNEEVRGAGRAPPDQLSLPRLAGNSYRELAGTPI